LKSTLDEPIVGGKSLLDSHAPVCPTIMMTREWHGTAPQAAFCVFGPRPVFAVLMRAVANIVIYILRRKYIRKLWEYGTVIAHHHHLCKIVS
jgi:hypothetical protein